MRREKTMKHAFAMAVCGVALLSCALCASCIDDVYDDAAGETDGDTFSVQLRVVVKNLADGNGYEDGTGYENYIRLTEVEGGTGSGIGWLTDYRIYFFDPSNDRWIGSLSDLNIIEKVGSDYTVYNILGETAYISASESGPMKVVMVANWMSYPNYSGSGSSSYTLSSLCNSTKYDALVDSEGQALLPSPENGLIPFYGICEFDNVTFEAGKRTTLDEDISLLRAMAKIEVVLENEDQSFSDVTLHGYNTQGYCAPSGVESQNDYVHNDWDTGYVSTLHLVNTKSGQGVNDTDATGKTMEFVKTQEGNDTQNETWVAYVPEYLNTGTDEDYCHIEVKLSSQSEDAEPYRIYFADYSNGVTDNAMENRFDIQRNNLYRFYVKFNEREDNITVTVTKWDEKTGSFIVIPNGNGNAQYV